MAESGGGTTNAQIAAENTASAASPTNGSQFTTKQSNLTTARVNWNAVPHGDWGTEITSPDLAAIIQEVVDRGDWVSGGAINMWIGDNASPSFSSTTYFTYDCSGCGKLPTLSITYSGGGGDPTPTPTLSPTATPTPTPTAGPTATPTVTPTPILGESIVTVPIAYASIDYLYYRDITLIADVGDVSSATVEVDDNVIPSTYDPATDELVFSTSATEVKLHLIDAADPAGVTVTKAPLKGNKKWAWSLGLDDNVYLKNSVDVLESFGWKGLFYLIGDEVDPTRDEDWIADKPYLVEKLNTGWSLGNHTIDHDCTNASVSNVTLGYDVVKDIVDSSAKPAYKIIAFAAPCFVPGYNPIITTMRQDHEYEVLFNESQGSGLMIVNQGASNYISDGTTAEVVTSNSVQIGRDGEIDWAPENVMGRMDWMASHATASRNFWLNTYLHGSNEVHLNTVSEYANDNYGPGGTNELWMAPADEVYSYLMVRENATIGTPVVE